MLQRNNGDEAMAKTYKVLVNDGKGAESVAVQVAQGAGDKGTPVRLVAQRGVRYELQDVTKGKGVAPDQVRAKRVGNNLTLMFDGSQAPDVVIEDYYIVKGEGTAPMLAGLAENGGVYEYIPQDPNANHLTPSLKDGNTPVLMALGGGALGEAFVLSALPIVAAAAGGISGWAIAAGVVGAAALGGGGGGGGTAPTDTTAPGAAVVAIPEASGGVNATEAADGTALDVALPADAVVGDTLTTVVTRPDGSTFNLVHVLTAADIAAKGVRQSIPEASLKDANGKYIDGTWTTTTTLTDAAKNVSTAATGSFVLDTTAPAAYTGNLKHDAANDTGINSDDSVTNNATPVLQINAETGAKVEVDINGKIYAATETATKGTYEVQVTDALPNATYNPVVRVTDAVGNTTVNGVFVGFTVDNSTTKNLRNGSDDDLNNGVDTTVAITAVTEDTGTVNNDFVTSARNVKISGTVNQFYTTGVSKDDSVQVQIFNSKGELISQEYVTPSSSGTWAMATQTSTLIDGTYTVKAAIVDAAGNVLKTATDQPLVISETYYKAVNDVATAQEDVIATHDVTKNNVLLNDSDVVGIRAVVTQVNSASVSQSVSQNSNYGNGAVLAGLYGTLKMGADGSYLYTVNNANTQVQALAANAELKETFTYSATNSKNKSSTADLVVTIKGTNDAAQFFSADDATFKLRDNDIGDQSFNVLPNETKQYQAENGYFVMKSNVLDANDPTKFAGTIVYTVNGNSYQYNDVKVANDLFTLKAVDGSLEHTFVRKVTFDTSTSRTVEAYHGAKDNVTTWVTDALEIDLTNTSKYRLSSIEKIDISDTTTLGSPAPDTIKLNLASITQADFDGTVHKLYIKGDAGDVVELTKPTPTWDAAAHLSTRVVSDVTYNVYQLDSTHELLINNAITTLTVS
jgi:VCBS repeat-containing protein